LIEKSPAEKLVGLFFAFYNPDIIVFLVRIIFLMGIVIL